VRKKSDKIICHPKSLNPWAPHRQKRDAMHTL
jgi:hypothetical protein